MADHDIATIEDAVGRLMIPDYEALAALARVEARLEAAEKALKVNTPCCKSNCSPLHWCEQCVAIAEARRALAGKDAAA